VESATAAPELVVEVDPVHLQSQRSDVLLDVRHGSELARPDDLVLVEQ
jgi:hypothetical protein